jgi:hypothetical protein
MKPSGVRTTPFSSRAALGVSHRVERGQNLACDLSGFFEDAAVKSRSRSS